MNTDVLILLIIVLSPIFSALITLLFWKQKLVYSVATCLSGLINIALLIYISRLHLSLSLSYFNVHFEGYGFLFALLVSVCWTITVIYSYDYLTYNFKERENEFNLLLSISVSLILLTGFAGNFFTLIFFYTASGISILVLLNDFKSDKQKIILNYLLNVVAPPLMVILPVCFYFDILFIPFKDFTIKDLGVSDLTASILFGGFIIFFSKNCVIPFHTWLPKISFAPAPLSALIHTVGAVQTGIIAILKISKEVYGYEYLQYLSSNIGYTGWISYLCGITAIYTAYKAWKSDNIKERFSYSTVGQLSYIISAITIGTNSALLGGLMHMITHGLAKITLFFAAGIFSTAFSSRDSISVSKIAPHLPWLSLIIVVCGISISGTPFLAGFYSKETILFEEISTKHYESAVFLVVGSFVNLLYIYPFLSATLKPYLKRNGNYSLNFSSYNKKIKKSMIIGTLIPFFLLISISVLLNIDHSLFNRVLLPIIER